MSKDCVGQKPLTRAALRKRQAKLSTESQVVQVGIPFSMKEQPYPTTMVAGEKEILEKKEIEVKRKPILIPMNCSVRNRYNKWEMEQMKRKFSSDYSELARILKEDESENQYSIFEEEESEQEDEERRLKKQIQESLKESTKSTSEIKEPEERSESEESYGERRPRKKVKKNNEEEENKEDKKLVANYIKEVEEILGKIRAINEKK